MPRKKGSKNKPKTEEIIEKIEDAKVDPDFNKPSKRYSKKMSAANSTTRLKKLGSRPLVEALESLGVVVAYGVNSKQYLLNMKDKTFIEA